MNSIIIVLISNLKNGYSSEIRHVRMFNVHIRIISFTIAFLYFVGKNAINIEEYWYYLFLLKY